VYFEGKNTKKKGVGLHDDFRDIQSVLNYVTYHTLACTCENIIEDGKIPP
jgi:hypothetical protein